MATNTYVALKTTVVGTATPSVTFDLTGISGYTDLRIVASPRGTTSAYIAPALQFNSDTSSGSTNYSWNAAFGDGSTTPVSYRVSNQNNISGEQIPRSSDSAGMFGVVTFDIMNYSNTTTHKTVLTRNGSMGSTCVSLFAVGTWRSTAAITSITINSGTPYFAVGSTFTIYGIAAEGALAKATGGAIYSDANYWYHAFAASGTFTPTQSLSCDYLMIAGGGGGGSRAGGGGGAGGVLTATTQSFGTSAYTITVGSGGAGGTSSGGAVGTVGVSSSISGTGISATANGGGYGGGESNNGGNGGSGGGGGQNTSSGGGTGSQGSNGGGGSSGTGTGAGGGGYAAIGANTGTGTGGAGSNSFTNWVAATGIGANGYIAGGGAGGSFAGVTAIGGVGGGGNGGVNGAAGSNGLIYTGGGGGGGGAAAGTGYAGGSGGSGIVVIRYAK